jgi:hypothetical protein
MRVSSARVIRGVLACAVAVLVTPLATGVSNAAQTLPGSWSVNPSTVAAGAGPSNYVFRYTSKVAVTNAAASVTIPLAFGVPQISTASAADFAILQKGTCTGGHIVIYGFFEGYIPPRVALEGFKCTKANQFMQFSLNRVTAPTSPGSYAFEGHELSAATGLSVVTLLNTYVNVTPAAAKQLVLVTGPFSFYAGNAMQATTLAVKDQYGNQTSSTAPITIGGTGPLTGTLIKNAVAGSATFSDLTTTVAGLGYTFIASSPGLTSANSAYNVEPAPANVVSFATQPTDTQLAVAIPNVVVSVRDQYGNPTSGTASVELGTNPRSAALGGTVTRNLVNGDATFNDLSVNLAEVGATLVASTPGVLTNATSSAFDVTLPIIRPATDAGSAWLTMGAGATYLGQKGSDAYNYFDAISPPDQDPDFQFFGFVTSTAGAGVRGWVWDPQISVDPRALHDTAGNSAGAAWYGTDFDITVNVPTGSTKITMYLLDWDSQSRAETVTVDDGSGAQPAHVTAFDGGAYVQAPVSSTATSLTLHLHADAGANAVISAVFAD